ncbi:UPF0001 protein [Deinococcus roseus]|uniref:UPF0001 protein n=1 Tax=Deinococcus roseus TaxID=392414 RepID=A0ABQ2CXQ9_9DEIO|nr:UPF0001 protein [Deinococcus roseus]
MQLPVLLQDIERCARAVDRDPASVRLIAVSKGQPVAEIRDKVLKFGHHVLAENRGQELRDKLRELPDPQLEWHFIGPIQSNKIKYLSQVHMIHTLEDASQATELARHAAKWGRAPKLLIQVHNGEVQKHGCPPAEVPALLKTTRELGLDVEGLMVMAPYDQPEAARQVFRQVADLNAKLGLRELSMGMSDDYPHAIEAGSTLIRIGSAIFL